MSPDSAPLCSIVIRTLNEEKHVGRLLEGIARQSLKDVEILVVDSGSRDATLAIVNRYPVRVISIAPQEFTFGRSLNRGCAEARGEFLVFASAHVYPTYPDWLERLVACFQDPQVALVYGRQTGNHLTKFSEHEHFSKMFSETSIPRQDHPFCNNANAAVRRALWKKRPYDEELPGLEDLDWAKWALEQGHFIAYCAEAEIVHVHEETPRQIYNRYRREAIALQRILPHEKFNIWDFVRLYLSNIASDMWHAFRARRLLRNLWSVLWFRLMQFWGTYRGFRFAGPLTQQMKAVFYYPRGFPKRASATRRSVDPIDYGELTPAPTDSDDLPREAPEG
jgi:glycosyltransferase involved in cell wall biosynthesis